MDNKKTSKKSNKKEEGTTKSAPFKSLATKTMERALKTQGREWFQFWTFRLIGWALILFIFSGPLYFAGQNKEWLNELFQSPVKACLTMSYSLNLQWFAVVFLFEVVYTLKWDCFEKWRANEEPWPWEEDPINYNELWKTLLWKCFLNQLVIAPFANLGIVTGPLINWNTDFNDLPPFW